MIRLLRSGGTSCDAIEKTPEGLTLPADVVWIDLFNPTPEEDAAVEAALGISVPTREEMREIEASSRLYRDGPATVAIADILFHGDTDLPDSGPITFVLTGGPLVTVRYFEPRPITILMERIGRESELCATGATVFLNLMEAIIDRTADVLEKTSDRVEAMANHIFGDKRTAGFEKIIGKLGRARMATARIEQSLAGLARVFAFAGLDERIETSPDARNHLRTLTGDAQSLIAHAQAVAANIDFQLNAALGLINIEQSSIIKIFSVAAVAFLPPTLIASIYGMNFEHMPELHQPWAYPTAVVAMIVSAIAPLIWFRKKGWL